MLQSYGGRSVLEHGAGVATGDYLEDSWRLWSSYWSSLLLVWLQLAVTACYIR